MEAANLIGEHAVFVCQETEAPLFLQQCFSAAISDELLHVHLARRDGLHILQTGSEVVVREKYREKIFVTHK